MLALARGMPHTSLVILQLGRKHIALDGPILSFESASIPALCHFASINKK